MNRRDFVKLMAGGCALLALRPSGLLFDGNEESGLAEAGLVSHSSWIMGQICNVWIQGVAEEKAHEAINEAFAAMRELERSLSRFDPASELHDFLSGDPARSFRASPGLVAAVNESRHAHRGTAGAFDPTVKAGGPASGLSGILQDGERLRRASREVELDFGGIGCGLALDRAASILRRHGVQRALLELSGDYLALSAPEGMAGWPLAVADPWTGAPSEHVLDLRGEALATSSSRAGTILNPRTGGPVSRLLQVSVAAPTAALADQCSTALLVREHSWFDVTQVARWA